MEGILRNGNVATRISNKLSHRQKPFKLRKIEHIFMHKMPQAGTTLSEKVGIQFYVRKVKTENDIVRDHSAN